MKTERALLARLERDPWVARVASYRFRGANITLATGHDLFSSSGLDVGTSRLLRVLEKRQSVLDRKDGAHRQPLRVLDLGCGIGSIGITLVAALPDGAVHVTMTDRDLLAMHVTALNAEANGDLPLTLLPAGFGYQPCRDHGAGPFDLILSNVPAKAGKDGLRELLFGAGELLAPGGVVAIVHVTPLDSDIDALVADFERDHGLLEQVMHNAGKEHRVRGWRFPDGLPHRKLTDPLVPFLRDDAPKKIVLRNTPALPHLAVRDVPEFDTPHYRTPILTNHLAKALPTGTHEKGESILVLDPAHGFLPALLADRRHPRSITLASRDTLSLAIAKRNLRAVLRAWSLDELVEIETLDPDPQYPWLPSSRSAFDLITGPVRWKEGREAHTTTLSTLRSALCPEPPGVLALAVGVGQLAALKKLARDVGLKAGKQAKRKGIGAQILRME